MSAHHTSFSPVRLVAEDRVTIGVKGAGPSLDIVLVLDEERKHITIKALRYNESWTASIEDIPCWPTAVVVA